MAIPGSAAARLALALLLALDQGGAQAELVSAPTGADTAEQAPADPWLGKRTPTSPDPPGLGADLVVPEPDRSAADARIAPAAGLPPLRDRQRPPGAPDAAAPGLSPQDPDWRQDVRSNIRDKVREIKSELGLEPRPSQESPWEESKPHSDRGEPTATQWESAHPGMPREPARSAAQIEQEKLASSLMLDKLIDDLKPWALGALGVYLLYLLTKAVMSYSRYQTVRKLQRQTQQVLRKQRRR